MRGHYDRPLPTLYALMSANLSGQMRAACASRLAAHCIYCSGRRQGEARKREPHPLPPLPVGEGPHGKTTRWRARMQVNQDSRAKKGNDWGSRAENPAANLTVAVAVFAAIHVSTRVPVAVFAGNGNWHL